ncbi:MAG TPA: SCO family protein [Gammaproteobacteria bacterium]|nr:SCO family protein [Gammaproteobacteria bacterium]
MKHIGWLLLSVMLLSGCGQQSPQKPWGLLDLTGHLPDLKFNLTRDDGQPVDQRSFVGKVTLLYFGYTHCPDACPTTLAELGVAIRQLGPEADQVQALFVSVDPARDTPTVLKEYVHAFGPWFVGLTGSQDQLQALTKRYRVAYRLDKPDAQGNYTVYHSSAVFIFDKHGRARLLTGMSDKPAVIATDLKRLLQE